MSRVVAAVATALTLVLLVSGCSGGAPDQDPDVVTTLAPTEPQTATAPDEAVPRDSEPPELPAAATKNTEAGAEAFARHWIEVFNYAAGTGYVEELQSLSTTDCGGCRRYVNLFSTTYGSGGSVKGGEATLSKLRSTPADFDVDWSGVATIEFAASTVTRSNEKPNRIDGEQGRVTLEAVWDSGAWKLKFLMIAPKR